MKLGMKSEMKSEMKLEFKSTLRKALLTSGMLGFYNNPECFADQITKLLSKQSAAAVETNDSSAYKKGSALCFEDSTGQKVGCGKVVKITPEKIYVRFPKGVYDKVSVGLNVAGKTSGSSADKGADKVEKEVGSDGFVDKKSDEKSSAKFVLKKVPSSMRLLYLVQPVSPVIYSNLTYDNTQNPKGNPWLADSVTKSSFFGIAGEGRIGLSKAAIDLGLSYRKIAPATITSNYISGATTADYLENVASLSAIRFWGDYVKYFAMSKSVGIPMKVGLDFDMSTVSFVSSFKNDSKAPSSADFVAATSKINVISLRLGGGLDWTIFGPVGISVGGVLIIPVTQMGGSFAADNFDANYAKKPDTKVSDLQDAIAHKKGSFGFEGTLGMFASF